MTQLNHLTIAGALAALKKKEFTATELVQAHIDATEKLRGLNCYITETPELALAAAKAADARYAAGNPLPLDGIPLANKDLFCSKDVRTTAASKILDNYVPVYESNVGQNLLNAGVAMLGKANLDEFAMGSANITSAYGYVENPWKRTGEENVKLVPGGSSGGSSAIVAARGAMGATGTDTGGSIRQPAAFTGIVGIKPTYGRCSRWGVIAFASSLDQPGAFARTVEDTALMLNHMAGHDAKDSTSAKIETHDFTSGIGKDIKGLRIGIPKEYRPAGLNSELAAFWDKGAQWLKDAGAEIVEISLPHTEYALPCYYIIAPAECSSNLARYDGMRYGLRAEGKDLIETYEKTRAEGFGREVKRRIMIGTYV
ncbi:MAG TPA: Asp-tRNA(Asn)/Glu-tRNA(Gln) amidotransferase subunit GatA, partial [Rhodospirillaceae bacterium]|nr:Asp-tRNA(Asn)/Glu-tRNA(Gln) amidotransferase subunit GatA [Rhodospirillaceae bacterium]